MIQRCWYVLLCAIFLLTACGTPAASKSDAEVATPTPRIVPTEVPTGTPRPTLTAVPKPPTATTAPTRPRPSPTATLAPTMPPAPTVAKLVGRINVLEKTGHCQIALPGGFSADPNGVDTWISSDRLVFIGLESILGTSPHTLDEVTQTGGEGVKKVVGSYQETARSKTVDTRRIGFAGTLGESRGWGTLYVRQFGRDYCQITIIAAQGTTVLIDPVLETMTSGLIATGYVAIPANYLALGDSYALGTGASDPATKGYAGLFAASLSGTGKAIPFKNLGVAGATSADFLGDWATTGREGNSPLANAVRTLGAGGVTVVTLDIGGNDILGLVKPGQPCEGRNIESDACFAAMRAALRELTTPNLTPIIAALVEAAPAGTQIIVLTYPNPFSAGKATTTEERTDAAMTELNILITNAVRANQAKAADRDVNLTLVELAPLFNKQGAKLTHIADKTPDIHPNDAGHAAIAEAIKKVYKKR